MTALVRGRTKGEIKMAQKIFTYDEAESIGEELDDQIRSRIGLRKTFEDLDLIIEGGYNIITDDSNFEDVEVLEIYYSIKRQ